jgi:hypothetical protein
MQTIKSVADLKSAISALEKKQSVEGRELKEQFLEAYESLKPVNILKNAYNDFVKTADFNGDFIDATISIAGGYLTKKMLVGETHNPFKQFFGSILQMGVTNVVAKNVEGIKAKATEVFKRFFAEKEAPVE